jgi:hypothetical protein
MYKFNDLVNTSASLFHSDDSKAWTGKIKIAFKFLKEQQLVCHARLPP